MAGSVALAYKLFGEDVSASKTIEGVGKRAHGLGKSFADMGKIAGGAMAGIGLASLGAQAVQFGKDSMDAFSNTGAQVLGLQRVAGGTAEQMSHLAAAAAMTGTDTDVLQKSIGILAKNMSGPGAKSFAAMGIATRDSQGHLRSFADVLPQLADRFAKMPAGADKTALALKLFGKSGLAMLPILNKGSEGLDAIAKASDEAGTTLGGKDLEAVKANTKAKREFGEVVKGLQIAIGRNLYPVITALMNYFKANVMPTIKTATAFFLEHQDILLKVASVIAVVAAGVAIFGKALSLVSGIVRIFTAVQAAFNVVLAMNPIGLVVLAIVALVAIFVVAYNKVGWFRAAVDATWNAIKTVIGAVVAWFISTVWPTLSAVLSGLGAAFAVLWRGVSAVFGWIMERVRSVVTWFATYVLPTFRLVLSGIITWYRMLWNIVSSVFGWIATKVGGFVSWFVGFVGPGLKAALSALGTFFSGLWSTVNSVVGWIITRWQAITGAVQTVYNAVIGIWRGIADTVGGFFSGIVGAISNAFQAVKQWINDNIIGKVNTVIEVINKVPHFGPDIPSIPMLAAGGIVTRPTLAMIGEAGPEAVIPLGRGGGFGGRGDVYHFHFTGLVAGSPDAVAREVVTMINDASRRGAVRTGWAKA